MIAKLGKVAVLTARDNDTWTCLHNAAFFGRKSLIEFLLESGAEVNQKTGDNQTALWIAAVDAPKQHNISEYGHIAFEGDLRND